MYQKVVAVPIVNRTNAPDSKCRSCQVKDEVNIRSWRWLQHSIRNSRRLCHIDPMMSVKYSRLYIIYLYWRVRSVQLGWVAYLSWRSRGQISKELSSSSPLPWKLLKTVFHLIFQNNLCYWILFSLKSSNILSSMCMVSAADNHPATGAFSGSKLSNPPQPQRCELPSTPP